MIRKYQQSDLTKVLHLLHLNTPQYFDPSEEKAFIQYLENKIEDYFVFEKENQIVAVGGINYFSEEKSARIAWDMVHPDFHGQGIGTQLLKHRLNVIKEKSHYKEAVVRTSQLVYSFYQKTGFQLEKIEKDFWAEGFDLYLMKLEF
jgi:N-acetylglutamate synthase-like GNAT family acetyltransferase